MDKAPAKGDGSLRKAALVGSCLICMFVGAWTCDYSMLSLVAFRNGYLPIRAFSFAAYLLVFLIACLGLRGGEKRHRARPARRGLWSERWGVAACFWRSAPSGWFSSRAKAVRCHAVCLSGKSRRASSDYCGAGAACEAAIRCCVENGGLVDGVGIFDRDHVAPRLCQRIGGGGCRSASWCDLPDCGVSRCSCFDASLRSVGGIKRGGRAFACAVKCADAPFCLMWDASAGACGGRRRDVLCSLSLPHPSCWAMCERALLRREP